MWPNILVAYNFGGTDNGTWKRDPLIKMVYDWDNDAATVYPTTIANYDTY